jgi:Phosphatidylinositol-specific phospholipase C, X domain
MYSIQSYFVFLLYLFVPRIYMDVFRILLILLILVIFIYVMSRLLLKRRKILAMKIVEGATTAAQEEVKTMKSKYSPTTSIKSISSERSGMDLAQYCMKGSYNSAYSGSLVSVDAIKFVLSRGYRVLDLEIADDSENGLVVVYSKGGETIGRNKASMSSILNAITTNAFLDTNTPNAQDPLFIHLRVQPSNGVYNKMVPILSENIPDERRYLNTNGSAKTVNGSTSLNDVKGKVILVMDTILNSSWSSDSPDLANYINAQTGGSSWKIYNYGDLENRKTNPPTITDNYRKTDLTNIGMIKPDNLELYPCPIITSIIPDYGIQIVMVRAYVKDDGMIMSEDLFDTFKAGIVPMAYAIQYLNDKQQDLKTKKIDYSLLK